MRRLMLLAAATALLAGPALAQVDTLWARTFDGTAHDYDYAATIAADGSGNIYVAGYATMSGTDKDFVTIKYYPNGDTAWVRTYNGPGNAADVGRSIAVDAAGNAYVTGHSRGIGTGPDFATVKYDSLGNTRWVARYSATGDTEDIPVRVKYDHLGNVYVTGFSFDSTSSFDYLTVKYDSTGETLWTRRFDGGSNGYDTPYDMAVDSAGNAFVAGRISDSAGQPGAAMLKYGPNGDLLWVGYLRFAGYNAVALGGPGRVYAAGYWVLPPNVEDFAVVAYDAGSGDTAWTYTYDGPAHDQDQARVLAVGPAGTVYAAGMSCRDTVNWNTDYLTVKLQPNGTADWVKRLLGPYPGSGDYLEAIGVDASGTAYVTGYAKDSISPNTMTTVAYLSDGTEAWVSRYRPNANTGEGTALAVCDSATVCVTGYYHFGGMATNIVTVKYGPPPAVAEGPGSVVAGHRMARSVVRNVLVLGSADSRQNTGYRAELLDAAGRKVVDLHPGENDVRALAPGVYFVREEPQAASLKTQAVRKVVVTR
jgi:hypothetical protein